MLTKRYFTIVCLLAWTGCIGAIGCSSEPKDPYTKWDAAMKYNEYVPPTALPVKSGTGVLEYTTTEDGKLYLMDTTETIQVEGVAKSKVMLIGFVPAKTTVIFDPNAKRVRVKGREGLRLTEIVPGHMYEFRFDPSAKKPK